MVLAWRFYPRISIHTRVSLLSSCVDAIRVSGVVYLVATVAQRDGVKCEIDLLARRKHVPRARSIALACLPKSFEQAENLLQLLVE